MFDKRKLTEFLIKAKRNGYANEGIAMMTKDGNGATTIFFREGDFEYEDRYFGGEPFGGSEVVFYKGGAIWMMSYYGKVHEGIDPKEVYPVLKKALSNVPDSQPFRGLDSLMVGNMKYENTLHGYIDEFSGMEWISKEGVRLYTACYFGGLVDQR